MRFQEERESSTDSHADHPNESAGVQSYPADLIVVSNRQPYRHEFGANDDESTTAADGSRVDSQSGDTPDRHDIDVDCPTGGLTAGLDPVMSQSGGTWIAWGDGDADRTVSDDEGCVEVPPDDGSYTLQRVWLSEDAVEGYYYGFSNRVLWPICHEFPDLVEHRPGDRGWYRRANRQFADAVAAHATDDSVVWLQDYHLALAPKMVRERIPQTATIAQFWHIPWPSPTVFQACPDGKTLLEGLLGNDLLGFHTDEYADAFLECVDRFVPDASVEYDSKIVHHGSNETQVIATPMGIDAETYDRQSQALDGSRWRSLRKRYDIPGDVAIGIGVDRLDYSKGIPERLAAIERLLEHRPQWRGEFSFIQKATPSRTDIPAYQELGEYVRHEVKRINARFATRSWRPIVYTEDFFEQENLCALYRRADVMIVSPLLDGMNLVAQEFVASNVDATGSLVLSENAGATDVLEPDVHAIDPTQLDEFAATIDTALRTSPDECHSRMNRLRRKVFENDLERWMDRQFDAIGRIHERASSGERSRREETDGDGGSRSQPRSRPQSNSQSI